MDGVDVPKFLQGLITNHMPLIAAGGDGFYTAFLTPQGRMLYDAFVYPVNVGVNFPHPKFIIECPASATQSLLKHLKRYILRSKVKIRDVTEEYTPWSVWGDALNHEHASTMDKVPAGLLVKKDTRLSDIGCHDPRVPGFGYRAVLPNTQDIQSILPGSFEELSSDEYTIRRILNGIPEGTQDMWPEQSLPLEANLDYMNGVDFRKGCYVGQELTIRTYHTGVVRKRIVPVQYYQKDESIPTEMRVDRSSTYPSALEPQMDVKAEGAKRSAGKLASGVHNIGLALLRLDPVEKAVEHEIRMEVPNAGSDLCLQPFLPSWWPAEKSE
ncbi:hypothetical protein BCR43DRAFT_511533 [Syncephalastrum racemosum]|uniref:CAF17 C-terminal domain-containing protein n=1 Tax=Syncephalastrum racemosum TaxID=13706 RepID=A0A1X2HMG9_SYNRA|nr:hypothetical protein BCR43DRAFT_511533 [Syncephalastrum racemosum]